MGEDVVRGKLLGLVLSVVVSVNLTEPAAAQLPADPQPRVPVQKPAPPKPIPRGLPKDCEARIVKDNPKTKIVGPFSTASWRNGLSNWAAEKAGVFVIAAPASSPGFMGKTVKHYSGCIFDSRDGALVFRRLTYSTEFPPRRTTEPGEK